MSIFSEVAFSVTCSCVGGVTAGTAVSMVVESICICINESEEKQKKECQPSVVHIHAYSSDF